MRLPIPNRRDLFLSVRRIGWNNSCRDGQDRRAARGCIELFLFAVCCEDERRRTLSNVFTGKYGYVLNRQAHQPWLCYGFGTLLPKSPGISSTTKISSLITVQTLGKIATGVEQSGSLLQRQKHRTVIVIDVRSKGIIRCSFLALPSLPGSPDSPTQSVGRKDLLRNFNSFSNTQSIVHRSIRSTDQRTASNWTTNR